jgi:hypothetical protein
MTLILRRNQGEKILADLGMVTVKTLSCLFYLIKDSEVIDDIMKMERYD